MNHQRIPIKPLSVNACWQGVRYKTPAYKTYERDLLLLLRPMEIPDGPLEIRIEWGMSAASDVDNPGKPFLDILQKRYGFNDNRVERLVLVKERVRRGLEYVDFAILPI